MAWGLAKQGAEPLGEAWVDGLVWEVVRQMKEQGSRGGRRRREWGEWSGREVAMLLGALVTWKGWLQPQAVNELAEQVLLLLPGTVKGSLAAEKASAAGIGAAGGPPIRGGGRFGQSQQTNVDQPTATWELSQTSAASAAVDPHAFSSCLWALAKLGYMPNPAGQQLLLKLLWRQLPELQLLRQVATAFWAVVSMGVKPPPGWVVGVLGRATELQREKVEGWMRPWGYEGDAADDEGEYEEEEEVAWARNNSNSSRSSEGRPRGSVLNWSSLEQRSSSSSRRRSSSVPNSSSSDSSSWKSRSKGVCAEGRSGAAGEVLGDLLQLLLACHKLRWRPGREWWYWFYISTGPWVQVRSACWQPYAGDDSTGELGPGQSTARQGAVGGARGGGVAAVGSPPPLPPLAAAARSGVAAAGAGVPGAAASVAPPAAAEAAAAGSRWRPVVATLSQGEAPMSARKGFQQQGPRITCSRGDMGSNSRSNRRAPASSSRTSSVLKGVPAGRLVLLVVRLASLHAPAPPCKSWWENMWSSLEPAAWRALEQVKSRESGRGQEGADEGWWVEEEQQQQQEGEEWLDYEQWTQACADATQQDGEQCHQEQQWWQQQQQHGQGDQDMEAVLGPEMEPLLQPLGAGVSRELLMEGIGGHSEGGMGSDGVGQHVWPEWLAFQGGDAEEDDEDSAATIAAAAAAGHCESLEGSTAWTAAGAAGNGAEIDAAAAVAQGYSDGYEEQHGLREGAGSHAQQSHHHQQQQAEESEEVADQDQLLTAQQAAWVIWSCARLEVLPPPKLWRQLLRLILSSSNSCSTSALTAVLWGLARLAEVVGTRVLKCRRHVRGLVVVAVARLQHVHGEEAWRLTRVLRYVGTGWRRGSVEQTSWGGGGWMETV